MLTCMESLGSVVGFLILISPYTLSGTVNEIVVGVPPAQFASVAKVSIQTSISTRSLVAVLVYLLKNKFLY